MTPCRFKFCGLKTEADVRLAVELGASAVGFVLTKSPRQIMPQECARLCASLPGHVVSHAVFGPVAPEEIRAAMAACGAHLAQIHGPEDPAYWDQLKGIPYIRAYQVRDAGILRTLTADTSGTFLLDAYVPGLPGGTGQTFDWELARRAAAFGRVILAGGLTPENVGDAIRTAAPWMVDVSGGIEREKGVKDPALMRAFAQAVLTARV